MRSSDPTCRLRRGASALKRTRYIEPVYPRAAQAAKTEGWVDLEFIVRKDGTVGDVKVTNAQPAAVFDSAASDALARWRFEPVQRNGEPVDQRARLRMRFSLQ